MPYISTEALVGAALLVVLAFGYQYIPKAGSEDTAGSARKKQRKKPKKSGTTTTAPVETKQNGKPPGSTMGSDAGLKSGARRKPAQSETTPNGKSAPSTSVDGRKEEATSGPVSRRGTATGAAPSFAAAAASGTNSGGGATQAKPKTLAEKIAPKPRNGRVDE